MKPIFLACILTLILFPAFSQTWRSSLYPETWQPGLKDSQGRFLHDFSYAGYRSGIIPLPEVSQNLVDVTKSPYFADKTGTTDVLSILQKALDDVGKAGGGVVFLPQGKYKVNVSASAGNTLKLSYNKVVLRGEGADKTFIFNDNSNLRNTSVIQVKPVSGGDWFWSGTNTVSITRDLLEPTEIIPVSSVANFKVGDWVVVRSDVTAGFIEEHQMSALWGPSVYGPTFYRYIVAIDPIANTLKVDAPTRYFLKKRDNACVYKVVSGLSEVGIENFSIGNRETTLTGFGEEDYNTAGTGAYEVHNSQLITVSNAVNCWIKNIQTYKPEQNIGDFHLVSNGIILLRSRFITVESCYFQKPQYEGGGGNGYMYILNGNDCLIRNTRANDGRHNFDFKSMYSNGNVILRCRGENSKYASDFHMQFSLANLFDNYTANKDFLEAKFRPYGTFPSMHGHPTTQSVFWNTNGEAYPSGKSAIVESAQWGWGYIIGTRGAASAVKTTPVAGTDGGFAFDSSPEDFKEGIGKGDQLQPESLYEDQLRLRIARNSVQANVIRFLPVDCKVSVFPNPADSGIIYVESDQEMDGYKLINQTGQLVAQNQERQGTRFGIQISQKGIYLLVVNVSGQTITRKVVVS